MVFLIWRWVVRTKVLATGRFYCEKCGTERHYRHLEIRRWLCPLFIPLIPGRKGIVVECDGCATRWAPTVLTIDYSGVLRPLPVEWLRRFVATAVRRAEPQHLHRRDVAISLVERALGSHYSSFDLDVDVLKVGTEPPIEEFASVARRYTMGSRDAAVHLVARVLYADGVPPRADLEWITDLGRTAGIPDDRLTAVLTEVARAPG